MSPIRHMTRKEWLIAFWAVVILAAIVSTGALVSARHANDAADTANESAQRSEKGFCIAINLIESGAKADAAVADNPRTTKSIKNIRREQARGSLFFASQLRSIVRCPQPDPSVKKLYKEFHIQLRDIS